MPARKRQGNAEGVVEIEVVSARLAFCDQQTENELPETAGSRKKSCGRLEGFDQGNLVPGKSVMRSSYGASSARNVRQAYF